jgi:hypothetical protein
MSKRIMTIDKLYNFCKKNNYTHFNSSEYGKELVVQMLGNFEKKDKSADRLTEGLTPFISRAFHDHVNLNKSEIEEESFKENVPSSHLRPILAHIKKDEETGELDFGSHDYFIETDENGEDKMIYQEQPIGVIDGTKTSIEYDEEAEVNRAVLHGYLYDEYCQDAIDILNRRGTVDCSIELCIRSMSFNSKNNTLVLDDFYVSGLTLLSAKTKPGMAGSNFKIEDFSIDNKQLNYDQNDKLIEALEKLNTILSSLDINDKIKEGGTIVEKDFEEVADTEEVTETEETTEEEVTVTENESEETVDETSEEETVEDTTESEETEATENQEEPETGETPTESEGNYSVSIQHGDKCFEISLDEKIWAISQLVNTQYGEADNTYYGVTVYEKYVIMEDYWNGKYFKQTYKEEDDVFSLTGDRVEVFAEFVTAEEQESLKEMRSNYASLVEFKSNTEQKELHSQREAVLSKKDYSVLAEKDKEGKFKNASYAELYSKMDEYSVEDLEKEAKILLGEYALNGGKFSATTETEERKTVSVKLFANPNNTKKKPSRYGNLFNKN